MPVMSATFSAIVRGSLSDYAEIRERNDEKTALFAPGALAFEKFVEESPGQDEEIFGVRLPRLVLRDDRDAGADRILAPFLGASLGGGGDQLRIEAVVLKDR